MNVSYRWLKDMVPGLTLTAEEVAQHLALRGAPVEGMESPGAALAHVVVGRVVKAGQHPNADRLSVCLVDAGGEPLQVVCGAPNVKEGSWYPFAPVGAVLPGDFKLKKAKIRGERSEGMLCSAKELGLGADHAGILELEGDFTPGESFVQAVGLDDVVLDVEVGANRGDLLSHAGIARELAAEGSGEIRFPDIPDAPDVRLDWKAGTDAVESGDVSVRIEAPDLCHRYIGVVIRGVKIGPSPAWLQERLRGAGSRPINNVVDATNYAMLEMGQPLHAFDLHKLAGRGIVVRRAREHEKSFKTLDGEERKVDSDMLMICDAERPVAIGGVMGGEDSEVDDDTVDVLLECALFDPKSIRKTRKALVMSTDASYRFERGVDPDSSRKVAERAAALILATAGGTVEGPAMDVCPKPFERAALSLRLSRIETLLGVALDAATVAGYLKPLGFETLSERDGALEVEVPGFRSYDVTREVDLIEEVARAHGYDRFPEELGAYRPNTVPDDPMFQIEDTIRDTLVARGFFEVQTPAFVPEREGDVRLQNPVSALEPVVRKDILPSVLRRVSYNFARGARDIRLFEIATSFEMAEKGEVPHEETHLAVALTGRREPPHWSASEETLSVWDLKSVLEAVVAEAYRGGAEVKPAVEEGAGASFEVLDADGRVVGRGGLVAPGSVDAPVWADPVWGIELALPKEVPPVPVPVYDPLPQHPAVERDIALLVSDAVPAEQVLVTMREAGGNLLEAASLFDHYRGEGLPEGVRSLAFSLRFRAAERTLKDKEVDRIVTATLTRLKEELGVEPRG